MRRILPFLQLMSFVLINHISPNSHDIAQNFSHCLDSLSEKATSFFDEILKKSERPYLNAPNDEENSSEGLHNVSPDIIRARKFRNKYVLPRRWLAKRQDGELHWEQLAPGIF